MQLINFFNYSASSIFTILTVGISKLPTSWVFFKQEAWPCHVCPRATEIHAFGLISIDIGDRVVVCGR